ncbi:MAG: Palmitoyltransferase [Bathelium mastoideum]|nr:MAG: Palmitoyltransferase [Bathelium mastoideum]
MTYLGYLLYPRVAIIFHNRHLPSYLGPTVAQLTHLFLLLTTLFLTWTALTILLLRTAYSLATNTTTIESWELERHATLCRRARALGGVLDGPNGEPIAITRQEFPYDLGLAPNLRQGMGTANPLLWLWPLAPSPSVQSGLAFEVNGLEDPARPWPPPDPDRMPRTTRGWLRDESAFVHDGGEDVVEAFRRRQAEDLKRWGREPEAGEEGVQRRRPFVERLEAKMRRERVGDGSSVGLAGGYSEDEDDGGEDGEIGDVADSIDSRGEEAWKNSEGESLADFGLDEDVEFYDEEDIPLSVLMQRRQLEKTK